MCDWLRAGRTRGSDSSPDSVKSVVHVDQVGCRAHPAPCPIGTGGKAAGM
jgi:hypothetical protein